MHSIALLSSPAALRYSPRCFSSHSLEKRTKKKSRLYRFLVVVALLLGFACPFLDSFQVGLAHSDSAPSAESSLLLPGIGSEGRDGSGDEGELGGWIQG